MFTHKNSFSINQSTIVRLLISDRWNSSPCMHPSSCHAISNQYKFSPEFVIFVATRIWLTGKSMTTRHGTGVTILRQLNCFIWDMKSARSMCLLSVATWTLLQKRDWLFNHAHWNVVENHSPVRGFNCLWNNFNSVFFLLNTIICVLLLAHRRQTCNRCSFDVMVTIWVQWNCSAPDQNHSDKHNCVRMINWLSEPDFSPAMVAVVVRPYHDDTWHRAAFRGKIFEVKKYKTYLFWGYALCCMCFFFIL